MTNMARSHRKIRRSAEEKARLQAIRDQFQTARPSLDELVDSGDYSEPVKHGATPHRGAPQPVRGGPTVWSGPFSHLST